MTGIISIITSRMDNLDLTNPITVIDLALAVAIVVAVIWYLRQFPIYRVILGVVSLLMCAIFFFFLGFIYTALVFGVASNLILISLPLIFAPEIRHYLEKIGRFPYLKRIRRRNDQAFAQQVTDAAFELAERGIGATMVVMRSTGIGETIETGTILDARFSSKLLQNLFFPKSPMHDGAVIISKQRILAAGCLLPIHGDVKLSSPFGTRHRSALTITKDTDAVSIIVSEQRGEVSVAENGKFKANLSRAEVSALLGQLL